MELIPAFRCERCGHTLVGVSGDARCPECGTPTEESRPQRRSGLPWQRRPSALSWLATLWAYLRSPIRTYRDVRIETRSMRWLLFVNLVVASAIGLIPVAVSWAFGPAHITFEPTPGTKHTVFDSFPFIGLILPFLILLTVPIIWVSAAWFAPRKSPPLARAVPWCSSGITACGLVLALLLADALWLVRYLSAPRPAIADPSISIGSVAFLTMTPLLTVVAAMAVVAIIDAVANRTNRYANSLDPRP